MWQGLKALGIAFLVSFSLTPLVRLLSHTAGFEDKPLPRRVNNEPVPTLGGLAIFAGFIVASILSWPVAKFRHLSALYLASMMMLILGIIDDIFDMSPKIKFLGQVFISALYVVTGPKIVSLTNPSGGIVSLGFLSIPLSILWLLGITNMVNLIDGLDGLAAGTVAITSLTCILLTGFKLDWFILVLQCAVLGACLGFLPYNFYPARIFMGDSGALFLGFVTGALAIEGSLKGAATVTLAVPLMALGLPLLDTAFAIFRRAKQGQPVYQADGDHLHHRLLHLGLGQKKTVLLLYFVNLLFAVGSVLLFSVGPEVGFIYTLAVLIVVTVEAAKQGVLKVARKKDQSHACFWDQTGSDQDGSSGKGTKKRS